MQQNTSEGGEQESCAWFGEEQMSSASTIPSPGAAAASANPQFCVFSPKLTCSVPLDITAFYSPFVRTEFKLNSAFNQSAFIICYL